MSKFLKLVQENRPGEDRYTVELKDVNGEVIDSFEMWGTGSPFENFDTFKREFGMPVPGEDQEEVDELTVMKAIEDEAAVDPSGLAGKAVEKRKKRINHAVKDYERQTLGL